MNKTNILRLIVLLLFSAIVYGQSTPNSFSLNKISGMPSDMVFDILQDQQGFMWFATSKGICRYDGLQVRAYSSEDSSVKSVSNIRQDSAGRIWFQDFNGNIFFIYKDKAENFKPYKANGFLKFGFIKNQLYIAGKDGIKIFDIKNFRLLKHIPFNLKTTKQTLITKDRFYLIGEEISYLDSANKIINVNLPNDYTEKIQAPIATANGNEVFIISKFNDNYLKISQNKITQHQFPFKSVFTQNANIIGNELWLCSTKGIYRYNLNNNQYQVYFPNTNISYIAKTNIGKHWISTMNNGVLYVEDFQSDFIETPSVPLRMVNQGIDILFSTNREEIFRMDQNKNISKIYQGTSDHHIAPLFVDELNNRLLFTSSKFIIKSQKSQLENILAIKKITQLDAKYYIISASTWNGIIFIDQHLKSEWDKEFEKTPKFSENGIHFIPLITSENGKDCVFNKSTKSIYFLTNYGVKRFQNGKTENINFNPQTTIIQLGLMNENLYLLSENEKIYQLKNDKPYLIQFSKHFENAGIQKIKIIGNSIFIFKENGIYQYQQKNSDIRKIINIPKNLEINDILEQNQQLFFSTNKGIIRISKSAIDEENTVKLIINTITVNDKIFTENQLKDLSPNENNLEINFDILSETPNVLYTLLYKIDDTSWEKLPNINRNLRFSSLSDGKHLIKLKISNGSQVIEKEILLNIAPSFYFRWWFVLLSILGILMITYFIFRSNLKKVNEKNRKELEKVNLEKLANQNKLQSLKSQMNPHFFFNALNTLQSYIVSNEKKEAIFYLSKFSKLTRSFLDMSDQENISINDEIQILQTYLDLEKARFDESFHYEIWVDDKLKNNDIHIPTLLVQPYVENAIKHGLLHKKGNKNLTLRFDDFENFLMISIDDNGIGRKISAELNAIKNREHKSFATKSLQERIQLLNRNSGEKISVEYIDKTQNQGTTVKIKIKKKQNE